MKKKKTRKSLKYLGQKVLMCVYFTLKKIRQASTCYTNILNQRFIFLSSIFKGRGQNKDMYEFLSISILYFLG